MKLIITWFTIIALTTNCNSKKTALTNNSENTSQQSEVTITYKAHTRGFFQELVLKQNSLTEFKDHKKLNAISSKLDTKEWEKCISLLNAIDLKTIPNLKSPTNYRQYDGAPFAQLTVIRKGDTIQSSSFDHKYPPDEIEPLVEYILTLNAD